MSVAEIYYFNGSVSDPESNWNNEAFIIDANLANYAMNAAVCTKTSKYITVDGVNCGIVGPAITQVRAAIYAYPDGGQTVSATIYTDGEAEELGTAARSGSLGVSAWVTLTVPSGGWTWAKVAALEARGYATTGGQYYYYVKVEVSHDDTVETFYFDASDDAITDPDNNCSDEAYITDGTYTNYGVLAAAGSKTSKYVQTGGTGAAGTKLIDRVRVRAYQNSEYGGQAAIYTNGLAEELGTTSLWSVYLGVGFTFWVTLAIPTGGWTWVKVAALEFRAWAISMGHFLYYVQVEVAYGATDEPVPGGLLLLPAERHGHKLNMRGGKQ
jgi:hypothetical protein